MDSPLSVESYCNDLSTSIEAVFESMFIECNVLGLSEFIVCGAFTDHRLQSKSTKFFLII